MAEKILIVDDDTDTLEFMKIIITRQGYQTITAKDGIDALEKANTELPDLIVLDVMMPRLDGFEVARSLHRRAETALIPILMFTARTTAEDKVAGYEAGVNLYLTKPVHPVDLQANIKALLMQRKARKTAMADRAYVVGIVAAKGGQGVSTTAINLAVNYSRLQKVKVIAAEMRPGQGTWADELGLQTPHNLTDLLKMDSTGITQSSVENHLTRATHGIRVMLAGGSLADSSLVSAISQYEAVLNHLSRLAPLIVLDIGTPYITSLPIILDACDELIVVTEPQILAVRRTAHLIEELRKQGFGTSKPLTLISLNHTRSDSILSISQIEAAVKIPVALGIPPANELAARAGQSSTPLVILQPEALVSLQFNKLVEIISKHIHV